MKFPAKILVGYKPVTVVRKSEDDKDGGYYKAATRELMIANDVTDDEQGLAALHEMVHLAIAERDIDLEDDLEEQVCDAVSRTLAEIITRNPALLPLIAEALK
jgi:hypothetical protein